MAKKKSKAQQKEERRRAMARKRQETGWQPPPEPDPAPSLAVTKDGVVITEPAMVPFLEMILNSDALIEEPEFEGVYAQPLLCVQALGAAIGEQGLEGVDPDDLPTVEREETHRELLENMTLQVLTPELEEAILSALRDLRHRAREEGQEALMAQAAAVYAFLDGMGSDEVWGQVGVVQALVHRSLNAGVEMHNVAQEAAGSSTLGGRLRGFLGQLTGAAPEPTMDDVLAKYPGLKDALSQEVQGTWENRVAALGSGELDLGLFSEAEISSALEAARSMGLKLAAEGNLLVVDAESAKEKAQAFASWLSDYVDDLATPWRLAHMQSRLDELAETVPASQLAFLGLLNEELEEADNPDQLRPVLERALVGEMRNVVLASEQAEG